MGNIGKIWAISHSIIHSHCLILTAWSSSSNDVYKVTKILLCQEYFFYEEECLASQNIVDYLTWKQKADWLWSSVRGMQCDQTWQNLATCAKKLKTLANFCSLFSICQTLNLLWYILILLGNFYCFQMAKY